jgi:hypothetical protein
MRDAYHLRTEPSFLLLFFKKEALSFPSALRLDRPGLFRIVG